MKKFLVFLCLVIMFSSCAVFRPETAPQQKLVMPWVTPDSRSFASLKQHRNTISAIMPTWYSLDSAGCLHPNVDTTLLTYARDNKIPIMPLIINDGFRVDVAESLFTTAQNRERIATTILDIALSPDFVGINLDFEGPWGYLRPQFAQFVELVAAKLHNYNKIISIDVVPTDHVNLTGWAGPYDYAAIGKCVDYFMLMGYDYNVNEHPPTPNSPLPWLDRTLAYALSINIPPEKVVLGIPFYGRWWRYKTDEGSRYVREREVQHLIQKYTLTWQWDIDAENPILKFRDEDGIDNIVYYENKESIAKKLQLLKKYNVSGIAIWSLGHESEEFWKAINQELETAKFKK